MDFPKDPGAGVYSLRITVLYLPHTIQILQGIRYLQEHDIVGESPESIAEFLRFAQGIDRTKVREYLGAQNNAKVLYSYIDNHFDFSNQQIDIALREFLQW